MTLIIIKTEKNITYSFLNPGATEVQIYFKMPKKFLPHSILYTFFKNLLANYIYDCYLLGSHATIKDWMLPSMSRKARTRCTSLFSSSTRTVTVIWHKSRSSKVHLMPPGPHCANLGAPSGGLTLATHYRARFPLDLQPWPPAKP